LASRSHPALVIADPDSGQIYSVNGGQYT